MYLTKNIQRNFTWNEKLKEHKALSMMTGSESCSIILEKDIKSLIIANSYKRKKPHKITKDTLVCTKLTV